VPCAGHEFHPAPPAAVAPESADAPDDNVFAFDTGGESGGEFDLPLVSPRYRSPRPSAARRVVAFGVIGLLLAAAVGAGFYFHDIVGTKDGGGEDAAPAANAGTDKGTVKSVDLPTAGTNFPRRFLAVCVHDYLYANPVSARGDRTGLPDVLRSFARDRLRADPDQIYILSDASRGKDLRPPVKPIIEQTVERFLATCRRQDRVMLVFVGHAVELDGQPYLVPLEGELAVKETLIPLKWLYDRLATCPARQKVLVMDVCREDAARGNERPGGGPMGPKLDVALANPPAGVQVLSACVAGQVSHEYDYATVGGFDVRGGAFLSLLTQAPRLGWGLPKPEESLPISVLVDRVKEPLALVVSARDKAVQTPRLAGTEPPEPGEGAAYNPAESLPPRFDLPRPAALAAGGLADPQMVKSIFTEIALPPIKLPRDSDQAPQPGDEAARLAAVMPFRADALKGYEADYADLKEIMAKGGEYPVRVAVIHAVDALDKLARSGNGRLLEEFRGQITDDVKKSITAMQKDGPGRLELELSDAYEELEKVADKLGAEKSKRWRAHYDYVTAQAKARMAYLQEYNLMLGKAKRDELPPLDPKLHNGYRLSSQEKLQSPKEVKDLASESRKLLAKIIKENPGTPWEILAKRERLTALGLAWQPANLGQ
ncbi:MAG TPA: hypothetical protein VGF55_20235, partial [Gemmataceae bacterium]